MDGEKRRQQIIEQLNDNKKPISATKFAEEFQVSRQIIVGDIALLRASGQEILATSRGYLIENNQKERGQLSRIAVQHTKEQTKEELVLIVQNGGEILDVQVEHPLYGELTGNLHIQSIEDVEQFMDQANKEQVQLLSSLTDGVHLHTIRYKHEADIKKIKAALKAANILYENK